MSEIRRFPKCICGHAKYEIIHEGEWIGREGKLRFSVIRCLNCALLRTFPVPRKTTATSEDVRLRIENYELWRSFAQYLINLIKKHQKKKKLKLLDIGSNVGILVKLAKENGWVATGIDLNKSAVELGCQKFKVDLRCTSLEKAEFKSKSFNVVVLSHTLEHISQPKKLIEKIKRILKRKGILVIEVPSIEGLPVKLQKIRGEVWYGYWPTQHIWHFTKKTIRRLLEDEGFKILELHARKPMHYEKTGSLLDIPRDLILKLSGFLNMADQITLAATSKK